MVVNAIKSGIRMHELFEQLLSQYCFDDIFKDTLKEALIAEYHEMNRDNIE